MAADWPPIKGEAFTLELPPIRNSSGTILTTGTLSCRITKEGAATVVSNVPTRVGAEDEMLTLVLTAAEMDFKRVAGIYESTAAGAIKQFFEIFTRSLNWAETAAAGVREDVTISF